MDAPYLRQWVVVPHIKQRLKKNRNFSLLLREKTANAIRDVVRGSSRAFQINRFLKQRDDSPSTLSIRCYCV